MRQIDLNGNWSSRPEVIKGQIGEDIVLKHLEAMGYIIYRPVNGGAHPFDNLCANKDKSIFVVEIKTKPRRIYYPDTGINIRNYEDYCRTRAKHNIDIILFFVDEVKKCIYGGSLRDLETEITIEHGIDTLNYPLRHNGIIYFPLDNMKMGWDLSENEIMRLKQITTRSKPYDDLYQGITERRIDDTI